MEDQRSIDALDVSERYANGDATDEELDDARAAADAAAYAAARAAQRDAFIQLVTTGTLPAIAKLP